MAVDISNGGLTFKSDLDPQGFVQGANIIKQKEAEIRKAVEDGSKQQKVYSDEMLRAASTAKYTSGTKIKAINDEIALIGTLKLQVRELNALTQTTGDPKALARYNATIQETQAEITRLSSVGKVGFDDLGNKIVETTKKAGGFSAGLSKVWGGLRMIAYMLPGVGIAGLLAFALGPILGYISKLGILKSKIDPIIAANKDLAEKIGSAGAAAAKATLDVADMKNKFQEARDGIISKEVALKTYNEGIGKTLGFTNDLNVAESRTIKNGEAFIDLMFKKAKAAALMALYTEQMSKAAVELAKSDEDAGDFILSGTKGKGLKNTDGGDIFEANAKRNKEVAAKVFEDKANVFKDLYLKSNSEIDAFAKKNKLVVAGDSVALKANGSNQLIRQEEALQKRISEIKDKYFRKALDKDAEARQAVNGEFKRLADDVKKQNDKYDAYAKKYGAAKAETVLGKKVDAAQLEPLRDRAISDLIYQQQTAQQGIEFEKQKKLYQDYENYKTTFGEAAAQKRFGNEVKTDEQLLVQLKASATQLQQKAGTGDGLTGNEKFRLEQYQKEILVLQEMDDKRYADAYRAAQTYAQKDLAIKRDSAEKYDAILKNNGGVITKEQKANLEELKAASIKANQDEALRKTAAYRQLNADVLNLSNEQIKATKTAIETQLKSVELPEDVKTRLRGMLSDLDLDLKVTVDQRNLDILKAKLKNAFASLNAKDEKGISIVSDEEKNRLLKIIADLQTAMRKLDANGDGASKWADKVGKSFSYLSGGLGEAAEGISRDTGALGQSFNQLGAEIGASNEGLGDTISTMGELLTVASDAAGSVASFASGDIIGGITKAISAISGIFAIGRKARESELKAQAELKKYHDEIFQSQLDYNAELRKRIANEIKLNDIYKSRVENTREEVEANKRNSALILKDQQETLNRLLKAQTVTGMHTEKYGGFLGIGRKTRTVEETKSVAEVLGLNPNGIKMTDELFDRLEKLNGQTPLTGDAKAAYEQLKKLRDEYGSIVEANRQAEIALKDAVTGTTAQSLADSIKQGIASGKKSFADFADDIEGFLRQGILAGMSTKFIEPQIQKLQDELADFLGDGVLTDDEKKQFQEMYMKIANEASEYAKIIDQAGIGVTGSAKAKEGISGKIVGEAIKEDTANRLLGLNQGVYDELKRQGTLNQAYTNMAIKNFSVQVQNERNTFRTANNTDNIGDKLDKIIENTKASQGTSLEQALRDGGINI